MCLTVILYEPQSNMTGNRLFYVCFYLQKKKDSVGNDESKNIKECVKEKRKRKNQFSADQIVHYAVNENNIYDIHCMKYDSSNITHKVFEARKSGLK